MTPAARLLIVGLTLLALLLATVPQPARAAMTSNEFENCLLTKINSSRASAGAPALTMATDLNPQVRDWSEWMRHNTFRHMTSPERNPILPGGTTTWGENIAWTSNTADSACNQVHTMLMNSSGHRANILNPSFRFAALGAFGDGSGWWVTELFFYSSSYSPDCEGTFCDDDYSIFQNDIELVAAADITRGCNPPANDRFCPDDYVTRGAMAAFLARALNLTNTGNADFNDTTGSIFEADILRVAAAGITRGCNPPANDRFCPDDYVTRGAMAAFLARALNL
ncbi:MAG: CAP domain-containing protein [Acidimicrobiia bacterium]